MEIAATPLLELKALIILLVSNYLHSSATLPAMQDVMKILAILLGIAVWFAIDYLLVRGLSASSSYAYETKLKRNIFLSLNMAFIIAIALVYMSF